MKEREPTEHSLKISRAYFNAILSGEKTFEARRDDRGFQRGDFLLLRLYDRDMHGNLNYLPPGSNIKCPENKANFIVVRVTWILTGGQHGIEPGYVVMSIEKSH